MSTSNHLPSCTKRTARGLAACAALLACAGAGADAVRVSVYTDRACSSVFASQTAANGVCGNDNSNQGSDISMRVSCDSETSSSSGTLHFFQGHGCQGSPALTDSIVSDTCYNTRPGVFVPQVQTLAVYCGQNTGAGSGACYSGNSMAELVSGESVPVSSLRPGDQVLSAADGSGKLTHDTVFRVTHDAPSAQAEVVRLTTETGHAVELTAQHYVHVGEVDSNSLKLAGDVREGDFLLVKPAGADAGSADGLRAQPAAVTSVERVPASGLHNVHTLSSNLVVNGVVGSHFTEASTYGDRNSMAAAWYKLWHSVTPMSAASRAVPKERSVASALAAAATDAVEASAGAGKLAAGTILAGTAAEAEA